MRKFTVVEPTPDPFADQETFDFDEAWDKNFYTVEKWHPTKDQRGDFIYGSNRLHLVDARYEAAVKMRPHGRFLLRQRTRVLRRHNVD